MEEGGRAPTVVEWERILRRRTLRVLLVECDDSTRHIVAALLRKCSYLVAAAADGMKAWEVMKEKNYNFDIVLAEVDMPSLSGLRLLSKIMATEECKNIPVIMMSSHDSMGLVHKCMLKGAVDYLLKPVRKNELRNLWQHVWRRHCLGSSGNTPDNNAASNCISSNNGAISKIAIPSTEESDAQSSGSKPDNEINSSSKSKVREIAEQRGTSKDTDAQQEKPLNHTTAMANVLETDDSRKEEGKSAAIGVEMILPVQNSLRAEMSHKNNKPLQGMLCFVKPVSYGQSPFAIGEENAPSDEILCIAKDASHGKNRLTDPHPEMELPARGPVTNGCASQQSKEKHILIHSSGSAFSRYGENRINFTSQKVVSSTLCIRQNESCDKRHLAHNNEGDGTKSITNKEMPSPRELIEGKSLFCPRSDDSYVGRQLSYDVGKHNGRNDPSSNGEITYFQQPQVGFISVPIPVGMVPYQSFRANYGVMLQPIYHPEASSTLHGSGTSKNQILNDQPGNQDVQQDANSESLMIHPQKDGSDPSHLRQQDGEVAGLSSGLGCSLAQPTNQSGIFSQDYVNGVGSNGSGEMTDAAGNKGAAIESGNESCVHNCNNRPVDSDRASREAALMKFRLKRKERCFEKRVRYHSRKKLAEQRPRVKGQFVRQKAIDVTPVPDINE